MEQRPLGKTGADVSVVGLGTWQLGGDWGDVDDAAAEAVLETALDAGVTLLDTVPARGFDDPRAITLPDGLPVWAQANEAGERYLLSGIRLTITEALSLAAEVAGVERRPRLVPRGVASVAGTVVETGFRLRGRTPPVCREMVRTLLHGHRYDGTRAERELGLRYTSPRETILRTVEWAREQGLLRNV